MPTNMLRSARRTAPARSLPSVAGRRVRLTAGSVTLRLELLDTGIARLLWNALPLFSVAETWGDSIHFEVPLHAGRDRTARLNVRPGDVCFWADDERIVLAWGPTPISRPNEVRLMRPCNVFARTIDDPAALDGITPGAKVSLERIVDEAPT